MISKSMVLFRVRYYFKLYGFQKNSNQLRGIIEFNSKECSRLSHYSSRFKELMSINIQLRNYAEAIEELYTQGYLLEPCPTDGVKLEPRKDTLRVVND
jgi:hypothetical protein